MPVAEQLPFEDEPASLELFHGQPSQWGPGKVHLAHHDGNRWTARCRHDYPGYLMGLGNADQVSCKTCRNRYL